MGKKKRKQLSDKTVQDLEVGEGKVIVMTQEGNEIRVKGEIIELPNGQKHLQVVKNKKGNSRFINRSFGPGTKVRVEKWEPKQKL